MKRRSLALRKETLAELTTGELGSVVGGSAGGGCVTYSKVPSGCNCSGLYPSLNVPCETLGSDCRNA